MSELLKIDVSGKIEKKAGLSYLSWAWAWSEVLKIDPAATWTVNKFEWENRTVPVMVLPDSTCMVEVFVTINGNRKDCMLPVMDNRNKAITSPDAFAINKAVMRCMVKAVAMHGLGLSIYAGEDLPDGDGEPDMKAILSSISGATSLEILKSHFTSAMQMLDSKHHPALIKVKDARKEQLSMKVAA